MSENSITPLSSRVDNHATDCLLIRADRDTREALLDRLSTWERTVCVLSAEHGEFNIICWCLEPGPDDLARLAERRGVLSVSRLSLSQMCVNPSRFERIREKQLRHELWRQWAVSRPYWYLDDVPEDIAFAAHKGWFPAGTTVLDLGCGLGQVASYLARRGCEVVGIDISESAIQMARAKHRDSPKNLCFEAEDITVASTMNSPHAPFDVVIDRGCSCFLSDREWAGFTENLARWVRPGTRYLHTSCSRPQCYQSTPQLHGVDMPTRSRARFTEAGFEIVEELALNADFDRPEVPENYGLKGFLMEATRPHTSRAIPALSGILRLPRRAHTHER